MADVALAETGSGKGKGVAPHWPIAVHPSKSCFFLGQLQPLIAKLCLMADVALAERGSGKGVAPI